MEALARQKNAKLCKLPFLKCLLCSWNCLHCTTLFYYGDSTSCVCVVCKFARSQNWHWKSNREIQEMLQGANELWAWDGHWSGKLRRTTNKTGTCQHPNKSAHIRVRLISQILLLKIDLLFHLESQTFWNKDENKMNLKTLTHASDAFLGKNLNRGGNVTGQSFSTLKNEKKYKRAMKLLLKMLKCAT